MPEKINSMICIGPAPRAIQRRGGRYGAVNYLLLSLLVLGACQVPETSAPEPPVTAPAGPAARAAPSSSADRVAAIQERLRQTSPQSMPPRSTNAAAYQTWIGRNEDQVRARLGAPLAELRLGAADSMHTRAVLIYPAAPDEPTGLYLYLRGGRVDSVRHDEFNGFEGNSALHWFHTP